MGRPEFKPASLDLWKTPAMNRLWTTNYRKTYGKETTGGDLKPAADQAKRGMRASSCTQPP